MNYRHIFHAGNFADVAKHLTLVSVLTYMGRKAGPFAVIDTHAGIGLYDLSGSEARRTGEADSGIRRLAVTEPVPPLTRTYLNLALDGTHYAGSPLLAAKLLRPQDRLVAIEKHLEDGAALAAVLKPYAKARVEIADGYRRLPALLPPPERRGVILIDPPFEAPDEFEQAARAFAAAYRRFATGVYLLWFPVKSAAEADGFCGEILAAGVQKALRLDITLTHPPEGKLASAGLVVVNPPWQLEGEVAAALGPVLPRLGAEIRVQTVAGE